MSEVKSDPSVLPTSNDHKEILKQVEFYFSDNNLPFDKFLYKETKKNAGWVPIKTIHSFKRMRRFEPLEEVVNAIKESKDLLEVSEDNELVRRRTPLKVPAAEENKSRFARTVYAKGFGKETPTSQFDIEKFFQQFGETNQVRLRRTEEGEFKESVFAEFKNLEDAEKFVALDPKPKFGDNELLVLSKQAYVTMKAEQHNFADQSNGKQRKPKFNAYQELKKKGQQQRNHGKRSFGKRRRSDGNNEGKRQRTEASAEGTEASAEKPASTSETSEKPASEASEKPE